MASPALDMIDTSPQHQILLIPDSQQEDEDDLTGVISYRDSVVVNADWTIETINSQMSKGNIDLQPAFQRRIAWDDVRKSRLIESIIVGMPVPNIVLAENKEHKGRFIVIDGKQRLAAINEFMSNQYKLRGLDIRKDLNSMELSSLPTSDREGLENSTIRSTVIKNWIDQNFLYSIFFRLNSGSLPLSPQELRKALIGGNLLESIEEYLKKSESFHRIFGEGLDRRMRDSELVLRFIAYDRDLQSYSGNFKEFLDTATRYYENSWDSRRAEVDERLNRLDVSLDTTFSIFGNDSFKKWLGDKYEKVMNRAVFDCVARYFADEDVSRLALSHKQQVIEAFQITCMDPPFRDSVEKTPKTIGATQFRIGKWGRDLSEALSLTYEENNYRIS
jgi:hypothetical protein